MALAPDQRAELLALRAKLQPFREQLETAVAREEAVELAVSERLGRPAKDGDTITAVDDLRAAEIFNTCWRKDAL